MSDIIRRRAAQALLDRRRTRDDLGAFIRRVFQHLNPGTEYMHSPHIDLIAEYLVAVSNNQIKNLIVNIPPRELKSISVTVAWPAFLLGHNPSEQILAASYAAKLSTGHSVDTRSVIEAEWYRQLFPETIIAQAQNEKAQFATTRRGHRIATSVGASCIGMGGQVLISDDLVDPTQAASGAAREAANIWLDETYSTRKNNPKTAHEVLVMQRLAVNDPCGHILDSKDHASWELLKIPRVAEKKTIFIFPISGKEWVREEGHLLNPARNGPEEVQAMRHRLGSYGFEGQMQQNPSPKGGGRIVLDWFPRWKEHLAPEDVSETIISFDTAQKDSEIHDPSVGLVFQRPYTDDTRILQWRLVDMWLERVKYPDLQAKIINMDEHYAPSTIIIEDKSSGTSLLQDLIENTNLPVVGMIPREPKIIRMDNQTNLLERGFLTIPEEDFDRFPWMEMFTKCLAHFPAPPLWDPIDALSQFLKYIREDSQVFTVSPTSIKKKNLFK